MNRRLTALVAVWGMVLAGPTLVGPAVPVALGHAQLVTSTPGAGDVVAKPPADIRLVFSEPIDPTYSRFDLFDADGRTLATDLGGVDPGDPYELIATVDLSQDGLYRVEWRTLSTADGHVASGSFTFGIGQADDLIAGSTSGATAGEGDIHAGHDAATALVETESRLASSLGAMLAFGLPLIGLVVLRAPCSRRVALGAIGGLALASSGAAGLILIAGTHPGLDPVAYATGGRAGQLLLTRLVVAGIAAVIGLGLLRVRRPAAAAWTAFAAGAILLLLIAVGGHAAAYASPAPVLAVLVHLVAASIWVAGLLSLAWCATLGRRRDRPLSTIVPRFSALALVAIGLVAVTGGYLDWVQTRSILSLATPYEATLAVKIALAATAIAIGAVNFLDGGRERPWLGGFTARIWVEGGLAVAVLAATAVLTSGSPPGQERPIEIAPAMTSAIGVGPPARFAIAPGRPGPARFIVTVPSETLARVPDAKIELSLQRLDREDRTRIPLRSSTAPGGSIVWTADGGLLDATSRWDATVIVRDPSGIEQDRSRFVFGLDETTIDEGRAVPPIDPILLTVLVLVLAAVCGLVAGALGLIPRRVDRRLARTAAVIGGLTAGLLAVVIAVGGPL